MPYAAVTDLPASVREALPAHGQSIFLSAFNAAFKEYNGDEAKANATAWTAVKTKYRKDDEGKWVPVQNLAAIDNEGSFTQSAHDIQLQRLDIYLPYKGVASGRLKYDVDNFAGTEPNWDRSLAVFVPPGVPIQHVDHAAFARDPHGEARRLGYRIAGHHAATQVIGSGPGEPRVITKAVFSDTEADRLATEGKLSVSSGFDARILPDGIMDGKVVPNHVLYFLRNEKTAFDTPASPNDAGAFVNNLSESEMAEDPEIKGLTQSVKDLIGLHKENPLQKTVDNLTAEVQKRDVQIDTLTKESSALKADKQALDNIRQEQETKAKDARWGEIKNLYQPALFHKEKEAIERTAFEADNAGWMLSHVGNLQTVKASPAKGAAAVGNLGDPEAKIDMVAERGEYDPINHVFKGRA